MLAGNSSCYGSHAVFLKSLLLDANQGVSEKGQRLCWSREDMDVIPAARAALHRLWSSC